VVKGKLTMPSATRPVHGSNGKMLACLLSLISLPTVNMESFQDFNGDRSKKSGCK